MKHRTKTLSLSFALLAVLVVPASVVHGSGGLEPHRASASALTHVRNAPTGVAASPALASSSGTLTNASAWSGSSRVSSTKTKVPAVPAAKPTTSIATVVPLGVYSNKGKVRVKQAAPSPATTVTVAPTSTPAPTVAPTATPVPIPAAAASSWLGFYQTGTPDTIDPLLALESLVGTRAAVVNFFVGDDEPFPTRRLNTIAAHGATPMVTLEFWSLENGGLTAITNGSKDAYISAFADGAKAYGGTVWLRPFHEMNGDWYPWGATVGSNSPAQLVAAWKHVYGVFKSRGATNVKFVWCVNDNGASTIESVWPGNGYVDYTAIDQYNFGTTQSWSHWTTFGRAFNDPYTRVTALSSKPLFIAETGCVEQGGDKAAWIADMLTQIRTKYTKVVGVCWFNVSGPPDWRVNSSQASLNSFKTQVAKGF